MFPDGSNYQSKRENDDKGCTYCVGGYCRYKKPINALCGDDNDCMTDNCKKVGSTKKCAE